MVKPIVSPFNSIAPLLIQQYERYLPSAFDESMTILEKMNKIIKSLNSMGDLTDEIVTKWNEVMEWAMADGLTEDINLKLDEMYEDGTLSNMIFTKVNEKLPIYLSDYVLSSVLPDADVSVSLKTALTDAWNQKRKLVVDRLYVISQPVFLESLNAADIEIEGNTAGEGENQQKAGFLWRGTAGTMITLNGARSVKLKHLMLSGYKEGLGEQVYKTGSIALATDGYIVGDDVSWIGFETFHKWTGGYYHKHSNSTFKYTKIGFKEYDPHNIMFDKIHLSEVENFLSLLGSAGPVVVRDSSLEKWSGALFESLFDGQPHILLEGCYIENYPTLTPKYGISGEYKNAIVTKNIDYPTFIGNHINTKGIGNVMTGVVNAVSLGNYILVPSTLVGDLYSYIFTTSATKTVFAQDTAILTGAVDAGTNNIKYISDKSFLKDETSRVYDPFLKDRMGLLSSNAWVDITPTNGWVNRPNASYPTMGYKKIGNIVKLKGMINGSAATNQYFGVLPVGFRPSKILNFSATTADGLKTLSVEIGTDGLLKCPIGTDLISLAAIEFDLD